MPVFLVSLDLDRIGTNYTSVRKKLVSLNAVQAQGSVWFAKYDGTADQLKHHIEESLGHNDRLFISLINAEWSSVNMNVSGRWLSEQVQASAE
jgi:hypothetical protein